MKKLLLLIAALLCAMNLQAKGDLHLFSVENKSGAITPETIKKTLLANGFSVDLNSNMNGPFTKQFKETTFSIFTLMTIHHKALTPELVNTYPKAGVFTPMGVGIYQAKNESTLHVSILTSEAQEKILGIQTPLLKSIESDLIKALKIALPNAKMTLSEDSLKESRELVTLYELELDGEEWQDVTDNLEMVFEADFAPYGFIIAASMDLNAELAASGNSNFDFYMTYSICKLPVIYTVAKSRPEASAFAPCTTMLYKKKDEDKVVMGFPAVYNWMSSAKVEDKASHDELMKAQNDFESVLKNITE